MAKINPFSPSSPFPPGIFIGRLAEITRIETCLIQTKAGSPTHFMITGERGIGKTSLLNYVKYVAEGSIELNSDRLKYLVLDVDVDRNTTELGLVKKIQMCTEHKLRENEPIKAKLKEIWDFISRIEAAGVKINKAEQRGSEELITEEFSYHLKDLFEKLCVNSLEYPANSTMYDGILIIIDEADNSSPELNLGSFFKLMTERLCRRGVNKLMFGIAGLPDLKKILCASHPSSLRIFDEIVVDRLSNNEMGQVIDRCMNKANSENSEQTAIALKARGLLVSLSEGYPHFIQQYGYSAFYVDKDNNINEDDVIEGAFGKHGALELIGERYYRDNYYNKIQKDNYRQVLRIMADKMNDWVTKEEIRSKFSGPVKTLDNAIKALRDRGIILPKEGERGVYRLQHKGFAWWIKMNSSKPNEIIKSIAPRASG
jgi:Cdc6-like AAA superfamily ATPase